VGTDHRQLDEAAAHIRAGRLVAFPTETVYGLGADATDDRAVARVYEAKGRPSFNPLITHVADRDAAAALARFDARADRLAAAFWPGPLTLVLPRLPDCPVSLLASAGLDTLAVRVPRHDLALGLIRAAARPIVAPSANPSGRLSPTTAEAVRDGLGDQVAMVLDGGPCAIGVESTVVDLCGPEAVLLRPGGATREQIEAAIGPVLLADPLPRGEDPATPRAPGQLASHYAPHLPVRLDVTTVTPGELLLGFGAGAAGSALNLSPTGDLAEAAANLFSYLRQLDRPDATAIAVMPIPRQGLGLAINDRLMRAAAPRPGGGPHEGAAERDLAASPAADYQ
jgi:L-threonylcarbamoyladenylate synthase